MTDNNEFRVKHVRRSSLEPSDWLLTPEGKPLRARYLPYTPGDDPQVLQLLGYQPPRPDAPVIRVDRGIQTRGFHAGATMAGKILAAGRELRSGYPDYFELGTCLSYSTEPGSFAEIDEWTELRLVEDDQVARWIRTQEAYDAQLDERLGIDTDDHAEDFHTGWPDHDGYRVTHGTHRGAVLWEGGSAIGSYVVLEEGTKPVTPPTRPAWPAEERILVRKARLDGFEVENLIGTRVDHPSGERVTSYPRYELHDLDGEPAGELWRDQPEDVDQIIDWVPCPVREDATEWPTAKRIQVLAGTIDNERITAPVVAERVDWHDGAFSKRECFPKYQIVQGTAPVDATDAFYNNYDSDRITRYAVLEEGDDD